MVAWGEPEGSDGRAAPAAAPGPPPVFSVETDPSAPVSQRFDYYTAQMSEYVFPLTVSDPDEDFRGSFAIQPLGRVATGMFDGSRATVRRTPSDIARQESDCFFLLQSGIEPTAIRAPAQAAVVNPGELMVAYADELFEVTTLRRYNCRIWTVPRALVAPSSRVASRLHGGIHLPRGHGVTAMLSSYLAELARQSATLSPEALGAFSSNLGQLVAIAGGASDLDETRHGAAAGQLSMVKQCIEHQLSNPLLSPARVASACGISKRKLYALFEGSGETFGEYVMSRRLDEARARLLRSARPVTEIIYDLGFNSPAAFYRGYRARFDEAPGDTRAALREQA